MKIRTLLYSAAVVSFVICTASCRTETSDVSSQAAPLSVTTFTADASYSSEGADQVTLRWNAVTGASGYTLYRYSKNEGIKIIKTAAKEDTSYTDTKVTQKTEYVYYIVPLNTDGTESTAYTTADVYVDQGALSTTKWLFLFYADGDNNLSPAVWRNVQQCCTGLAKIYNEKSVEVVVLWDGSAKSGETENMIPSGSYLLELNGKDLSSVYGSSSLSYTDYSSTASWLTDSSGLQEVNMASPETVTEFLRWAQGRYDADHTVLLMSDHGGGPATDITSRALCTDNTNTASKWVIYTTDFAEMLGNAGYGGENKKKLDMIIFDACLEGTIDNIYPLADYAEYCLASPHSIPGDGLQYDVLVESMGETDDPVRVGCEQIADYKKRYGSSSSTDAVWQYAVSECGSYTIGGVQVTKDNIQFTNLYSNTLTLADLAKIDAAASAVNNLAAVINKNENERREILDGYLKSVSPLGNTLMYNASWLLTFDAGWFAYKVDGYAKEKGDTELQTKAEALETALGNTIVCAWRAGYKPDASGKNTVDYSYYNSKAYGTTAEFSYQSLSSDTLGNWFGLAIGGGKRNSNYWYGINTTGTTQTDTSNTYVPGYTYLDFSQKYGEWNTMLSHLGD